MTIEGYPQTPEEARVCEHGNTYWFGHECGLCDDEAEPESTQGCLIISIENVTQDEMKGYLEELAYEVDDTLNSKGSLEYTVTWSVQ